MVVSGVLNGVLPLIGVIVGAGLQFLLSKTLEIGKQLKVQKGQAYADYFKALALVSTKGKSPEVISLAIDAKSRICIYGSPGVVKRLSDFEKLGAVVASVESRTVIAALLREMRADMSGQFNELDEETVGWALFGPPKK